VKRVAETVDVLLTIDPQQRVQKVLQQASTRLNEAAALLAAGDSGAAVPLDEYKQTILAVATGSGGNSATQELLRQQVAENAAQTAASLPDDSLYLVKKTVLEASAELSDDHMDQRDVDGTFLVDTLDVLHEAILGGDASRVRQITDQLQPYLGMLQDPSSDLKPEVRKEAQSLLSDAAQLLTTREDTGSGAALTQLADAIAQYLPQPEAHTVNPAPAVPLTEAELDAAVRRSMHTIFDLYKLPQSRLNALRQELKHFEGSPDEGRYLRKLYAQMPQESDLIQLVRHSIQVLREKQILDQIQATHHAAPQETGSGSIE
jgi:hypothetical protein